MVSPDDVPIGLTAVGRGTAHGPHPRTPPRRRTSTTFAPSPARFREVLTDCDPTARVPTCPDWDAADLLWHLAGVQWFWARGRPAPARRPRPAPSRAQRPEAYAALLAAFDEHSDALAAELAAADPADAGLDTGRATNGRLGAPPAGARGADPPARRRADGRRAGHAVDAARWPTTACRGARGDVRRRAGVGHLHADRRAFTVHLTDTGTSAWSALGKFSGTVPGSGKVYEDEDDLLAGR